MTDQASAVGPVDPQPDQPRVYTCYPLITFSAMSDAEAAEKIHAAERLLHELPGVSTDLCEEVYRLGFDNQDDERWDVPDSPASDEGQA